MMQIEGTVRANLIAAVASARRWRGKPVHADTLRHWSELVEHAHEARCELDSDGLLELVRELEAEIAARA